MGSTWKPLVYHAAIELGWAPDDLLDNRRQVFPYSTTSYAPSPDHQGQDAVSLAWAGSRSENVASVWLLYHLTDRLDEQQVADLAAALGLARGQDETKEAYRLRIQKAGVLPTPARLDESLFLLARGEVAAALPTSAHPEDAPAVRSMLYGYGFDAAAGGEAWQRSTAGRSWKAVEAARARCGEAYRALLAGVLPGPELSFRRDGDVVQVACGTAPEGYGPLEPDLLARDWFFQPRPTFAAEGDLRIGELHVGTIDALASAMERRRLGRDLAADGGLDLYEPTVLYAQQDFRVLLGLTYVTRLAERFGVRTPLQPVLSLPLGASEITLEELTKVYEGLVTGKSWAFPGVATGRGGTREVGEPIASALLIKELRDVDGNVLYRAEPRQVDVTSPETAAMTADVLRQVVAHGTGTRARGQVALRGAPLPIGGKTGTTNDYRNVAFVGFVPTVEGDAGPVLVGVYTGYDDNREMKRAQIRVAGASGALPAWITIARGVAAAGLVGATEGSAPPGGWPVVDPETLLRRTVDTARGLPAEGEGLPTVLTRPAAAPPLADPGELAQLEIREPRVRVAPRTEDVRQVIEALQDRLRRSDGRGVWARRRRDDAEPAP
jgi:membrane peptidoglycan carboxypeptidase